MCIAGIALHMWMSGTSLIVCGLATMVFILWDLSRPKDDHDSCDGIVHDEEWKGAGIQLVAVMSA
jgi:hypothetical protein